MRSQLVRLLQRARSGAVECDLIKLAACTNAFSGVPQAATFKTASGVTSFSNDSVASLPFAASQALRGVSTSTAAHATAVPISGDALKFISEVDELLSRETATAKDVADAALALTYLQVKGHRRIWGKILEKAGAVKSTFDGAALSALLWALTASNVTHYKSVFELAGPAAALMSSLTTSQLSFVVEGLGKAGVNDTELFNTISSRVISKVADFSPAELARITYGFASAGQADVKLVAAVAPVLAKEEASLSLQQSIQVLYALARMGRADAPLISAIGKGVGAKIGKATTAYDITALLWSYATLHLKPDAGTLSKALASVKASAGGLPPVQQIQLAWSAAALGVADAGLYGALFPAISSAVDAGLEEIDPQAVALLAEAQALLADSLGANAPKLAPQVSNYAEHVHRLVADAERIKEPQAIKDFRADLAEHVAYALGARYRPEVDAAVARFAKKTPAGLKIDIAAEFDSVKVAIEAAGPSALTSSAPHVPLGALAVRQALLRSQGYPSLVVPLSDWAALPDSKAKSTYILNGIKKAVSGSGGKVDALLRKLNEPFDPYAE